MFPGWRADIKALAACPNVYVKLGGLAMIVNAFDFHLAPLPPSSGEMANAWRPYVETCIETFGANRCMFESNFPVDKGACSYPVLFNAFKRLAQRRLGLGKGRPVRRHRLALLPAGGVISVEMDCEISPTQLAAPAKAGVQGDRWALRPLGSRFRAGLSGESWRYTFAAKWALDDPLFSPLPPPAGGRGQGEGGRRPDLRRRPPHPPGRCRARAPPSPP